MRTETLSRQALNRATLARQLLLERAAMPAVDAVHHLVGLQAQLPLNPYVGLWSRLHRFEPEELARLLVGRRVVRIVVMRATLHLVTAEDSLLLRPLVQTVLDKELARHRDYAPILRDVDLEPVLAFARPFLAEQPRTGAELRAALKERFPAHDPGALAAACRNLLALVQVPPRGLWGRSAQVVSTTAESWLGRPLVADASIDDVVLRYLGAFGPATAADAATWSGLTGLREVLDRLRPQLRTFRDEHGRVLFDLSDAPRPGPDTPAPPRFLPEFDNLLLSHADRSRFAGAEGRRRFLGAARPTVGTVLSDGRVCGTWVIDDDRATAEATLRVAHVGALSPQARQELTVEGLHFVRFMRAEAAGHDVRLVRGT
ncbi:MAG TPA: winged helix DNA-binding domain-containing protein [Acidimicrobiales bacterium]|nr:winged helix DNA-binding domain-containing protein [Acidimicrobiales bacterium]